jgi:hypothetical protein
MIARSSWVLHQRDARNARAQFSTLLSFLYQGEDSQHRSHDHWVLHLEIVCHADGQYLNREDLATVPAARRAVHARVARDEELSKLVYEFARSVAATAHEAGAVRESGDKLWPTRRREARRAQVVVCRKVAVELRSASVWMCIAFWEGNRTSIQLSHSIGRMPIVTLLFFD